MRCNIAVILFLTSPVIDKKKSEDTLNRGHNILNAYPTGCEDNRKGSAKYISIIIF